MIASNEILAGRIPRRAAQIRPGEPSAFVMQEGHFLQINDMQGHQTAEMVAFNANDINEFLSTGHTRGINNSLFLVKEMNLYSNRRNAMFALVDDSVGRHDILLPSCDRRGFEDNYGLEGHRGCRDAFAAELTKWDIDFDHIPDPVNWFMNVGLKARGLFEIREPLSERNDFVILRALMDLIVAVCPCPQEQSAATAFNPTDILIRVYS